MNCECSDFSLPSQSTNTSITPVIYHEKLFGRKHCEETLHQHICQFEEVVGYIIGWLRTAEEKAGALLLAAREGPEGVLPLQVQPAMGWYMAVQAVFPPFSPCIGSLQDPPYSQESPHNLDSPSLSVTREGNNVFLCEGIGQDHEIEAFLNTFFFIF